MKSKGFTLVEMLVVLAIVGILTGVVLASTTAARSQARDSARTSNIKEIQLGLALYFDVNRSYPSGLQTLVDQKYIPSIPNNPSGGGYDYLSSSSNTYCIGALYESTLPEDNAGCSTGSSNQSNSLYYTVKPPIN